MRRSVFSSFILLLLITGCKPVAEKMIDIQGHRGARGYVPENTIPSFIYALEAGVTTLEMDVVVSADKQLVVSHEPWMSAEICSHPDGRPISDTEQRGLNIYKMKYAEIAKYDCGKRYNARFPQQKSLPATKPLLSSVITAVEAFAQGNGRNYIFYNIETKSEPEGDSIFHPAPAEFAQLLYDELKKLGIENRTTVQSFDVRTLQEMMRIDEKIALSLLAGEGNINEHLATLGFTPEIYSPHYKLVTQQLVQEAHARNMRVIPWTVNDTADIKNLIELGVDGIITDYPDRGVKIAKRYESKR